MQNFVWESSSSRRHHLRLCRKGKGRRTMAFVPAVAAVAKSLPLPASPEEEHFLPPAENPVLAHAAIDRSKNVCAVQC